MRRAVKVTLKYLTAKKQQRVNALVESYRSAVNFFIRLIWNDSDSFGLDKVTLALLPSEKSRLSARYRSQALKQSLEIVKGTKAQQKAAKVENGAVPVFNGSMVLDAKFVSIEEGRGIFDLVLRLSSLQKGKKITIPTRRTNVLNKWLSFEGSRLIQGCSLSENKLVIWVEVEDKPVKKEGEVLGVDIGIHKLITDSNGNFYGTEFKELRDKIKRKEKESKSKFKAFDERTNFINRIINGLPWEHLKVMAVEKLLNLKKGKKKNRSKSFRKAMTPWTYRRVIEAIKQKAQQHRVDVVFVSPAYTSRTCPHCLEESKNSRKGEKFHCVHCGYNNDADVVGAMNVLLKALSTNGEFRVSHA